MNRLLYCVYLVWLVLLFTLPGCRELETPSPSVQPTPDPLPILRGPPGWSGGIYAWRCLEEEQLLPHLCGVVPGQSTMRDVAMKMGEPKLYTDDSCDYFFAPGKEKVTSCGVSGEYFWVYYSDDVVVGLSTGFAVGALTLGEAVERLGPPTRLLLFQEVGSVPQEWEEANRADQAFLFWPEWGVYLCTRFYGTQGVGLYDTDEVMPFLASFPITFMDAFEPCTFEELESLFVEEYGRGHDGFVRWIEWPGLRE